MRILITNDDGIDSEGIKIVAEWAKKLGEVTVCAPKTQQSAKSHAITVHNPIEIVKSDVIDGVTTYVCDGTPVDCVRFATLGLNATYDLVFSGINRGYNIGEDVLYSGTVSAIFETALRGLNGIALSTEYTTFESAKKHLDEIYDYFCENELFKYHNVYNVNIPLEVKGIKFTKQGGPYFNDEFVLTENGLYKQQGYCVYVQGDDLTLDTDATMNGYIAVMPLSAKRDETSVYERVKKIIK